MDLRILPFGAARITLVRPGAVQVGDDRYPPVGERRNVQRGCVSFGTPIAAKAPRLRIGRRPGRFETCLFPGLPRA